MKKAREKVCLICGRPRATRRGCDWAGDHDWDDGDGLGLFHPNYQSKASLEKLKKKDFYVR